MKKVAIGVLALLIAVTARVGMSQTVVSGVLTGTVTDHTGASVPNVKVTLKTVATGARRTTTTNASGAYRADLPPGSYVVTAEAAGFTASENTASVSPELATIVDIRLTPIGGPEMELDDWYPGLRMYPFPHWPK